MSSSHHLGRSGHLAFWHHRSKQLVMFGGQNRSDGQRRARTVLNDLLLYDIHKIKVNDHTIFSEIVVSGRVFHVGFMIDDFIYSIGGLDKSGRVLDEFIEIEIMITKRACDAVVEKGTVPKIYASAITPVFYSSKMCSDGELSLEGITGDINWGEAQDLIKYEGFYMFGGRDEHGIAHNSLYIFSVAQEAFSGNAIFTITQPQMKGQAPPARHSHTMNYISKLGFVVIYGGRNDDLPSSPILSDLWLICLANMEYYRVLIGGCNLPNPRCCHTSFVLGSELVICGGLGEGYKYLKDIEIL